jgi:hypothetical protein
MFFSCFSESLFYMSTIAGHLTSGRLYIKPSPRTWLSQLSVLCEVVCSRYADWIRATPVFEWYVGQIEFPQKVSRYYRRKFPDAPIPNRTTIYKDTKRFRASRSILESIQKTRAEKNRSKYVLGWRQVKDATCSSCTQSARAHALVFGTKFDVTETFVYPYKTNVAHKLDRYWSKTEFCELVPSWGAWWRSETHTHS